MKTGLGGRRVDGYKWCCQAGIIIVLIRKQLPSTKKAVAQCLRGAARWARGAWWAGAFPRFGPQAGPPPRPQAGTELPRIGADAGRPRGPRGGPSGMFGGPRATPGGSPPPRTRGPHCCALNIMTTPGSAVIDAPTQPFSLRAAPVTDATVSEEPALRGDCRPAPGSPGIEPPPVEQGSETLCRLNAGRGGAPLTAAQPPLHVRL